MLINNKLKRYKSYWQYLTIFSTTSLTFMLIGTILGLIYLIGIKYVNSGIITLLSIAAGIILLLSRVYIQNQLKNKFPEKDN